MISAMCMTVGTSVPKESLENRAASTTVVSKWQEARSLVFGSGRTGRGIGAVFANPTIAEDVPDYASRATDTARADAGFPVR
jgi:hypothetical protein